MKPTNQKLFLLTIIFSLFFAFANAADGELDTTFGTNGKVLVDFDSNPVPGGTDIDFGLDVAVQADGKILVSGESFVTSTDSVFSITRLNTNGTLDTTFATNGKFLYNPTVGVSERAYAIAVQTDGKIIVAGRNNSPRERIILRLNTDGSFDTTFGLNGVFRKSIGTPTFDEQEIAIQADGKIIVIGATNLGLATDAFSVMRLNANGTSDATFDNDGEAVTNFDGNDRAYAVRLQPDGKIVVSGSTNNNGAMAVARYNVNGSLDTTFDSDGKLTIPFSSATSLAYNLIVQPDNKIVLAGYFRSLNAEAVLVRLNPNGSLDTSFSSDGIASYGTSSNELFWDLHWRNGKIIGTGFRALVDPSPIEDFMVVRFNGDGTLDTGFGTNGVIFTDFNTTRDDCLASAMQSDGNIVLAGYSGVVTPNNPDFAIARYKFTSQKTPADFDGDGKSDVSVYRTINGGTSQWFIKNSSNNTFQSTQWGLQNDVPLAADFDGDAKTDIAVWRPAPANQASFYILNSLTNTISQDVFGQTGDNPNVAADFDGDGKADSAVFRSGTQSYFYYRGSLNNPNGNITFIPWGTNTDKPVVGDFNADGKMDFNLYRNGEWRILYNGIFNFEVRFWGLSTDKVAAGDYDEDGKTDIAVFRPSEGVWYIQNSSNGSNSIINWGISSDVPVPADYDGDGKTDVAVYRGGVWYILQSVNSTIKFDYFGLSSDVAIPSISVVQ